MTDSSQISRASAVDDFRRARRQVAMRDLIGRLTGQPTTLLSYEDVRQKLKGQLAGRRELRDVPVAAIVGSVGRYTDFTRDFLPRNDSDENRWVGVRRAVEGSVGVPPIELYQLGDAFFVLDGNHRVSVARQTGASHIQAYVTEVRARVPFTPGDSPDDLIVKAEYTDFLEQTRLDELRPASNLLVTAPGQYADLFHQIDAHLAQLAEAGRAADLPAAAADWYDSVYLSIVDEIRQQGILHEFPARTETDLFIWIARHYAAIEQSLGWKVEPKAAVSELASQLSPRRAVARLGERLLDAVTPDPLDSGPPPGAWRQDRRVMGYTERLVADLLVAISGEPAGWHALDQALLVAQREQARLAGLHVVPTDAARRDPAALAVQAEFDRRCAAAGVFGHLAIDVGNVARQICDRARLTDLVVASLSYPPGAEPIARLRSGFRTLVRRCPRPILAVPGPAVAAQKALLPYDGSPKSEEALYAATYLALTWQLDLLVVTVLEEQQTSDATLGHARAYLERHGVAATYRLAQGQAGPAILAAAEGHGSDMILIGGYGFNPLLEIVLGSSVDQVLRESRVPVLLCR